MAIGGLWRDLIDDLHDHVFKNTAYTSPTTVYCGLWTDATTPSFTSAGTEVSGTGYARIAVTMAASSAGTIKNSAAVTFAAANADWSDPTIAYWFIIDHLTNATNILAFGALDTPRAIVATDVVEFAIDDLQITGTATTS